MTLLTLAHLLGSVKEHTVGFSVAGCVYDLTVITAIWQAPGALAFQLVLYLAAGHNTMSSSGP